ncbi:MAG TPA: transketolase [Bacteroidales bacterium]
MPTIEELKSTASQVRRDIIRMVHAVQSGHPGGSLGCADLFTALYFEVLNHHPEKFSMNGIGEDIFILSNGHISPVFYSVLARSGYFPVKELATFRKIESRLQGHPATMEGLPGIRIASGSLGQGLSVAIGAALAKKLNKDSNLVYCLMGDGELDEGQVWEAATYAGGKQVDNLIAIVDHNKKQIDGPTDEVMPLLDLNKKFTAFGWNVLEMNGNKMEDILETMDTAKDLTGNGQPIMIIMHTEMGMGVDFMMGTHKWHGVAPNDEQAEKALAQLEETLGDY